MRQLILNRGKFPILVLFCIFAVSAFLLSCPKDDRYDVHVINPDEADPYNIIVAKGNYQTGAVGKVLPDSLMVYVSKNLVPAQGWQVDFKITQGEGTLSPVSNITDIKGYTGTTFTPSGLPGEIKIVATPYYSSKSVTFTITSTASSL
jgi:hypothetical protein